ncbi:hypothetical protein YC2023_083753 [Brassica napus]
MGCTRVHDMGCTKSHCTGNNNLSTWNHTPILKQIDETRFAENISHAHMKTQNLCLVWIKTVGIQIGLNFFLSLSSHFILSNIPEIPRSPIMSSAGNSTESSVVVA